MQKTPVLIFHSLGESGSRFFLRSKTQRRAATFVRELETSDGSLLSRTDDIERSFYKHYKELLSSEDPFSLQLYNEFIEPIQNQLKKIPDNINAFLSEDVSAGELDFAISKIRSQSSPGPDGWTGSALRSLYQLCPEILRHAINDELLQGKCANKPIVTRKLIFIPKPTDVKTIKAHRPISLCNSNYKSCDTVIVNRLNVALEGASVFPGNMFAYRKGHSISDANLSLQCFIENSNHTGIKMVIINFDISAAFDKCSQQMILQILRTLNCNEKLINYFKNFPIGAKATVCINTAENKFPDVDVAVLLKVLVPAHTSSILGCS